MKGLKQHCPLMATDFYNKKPDKWHWLYKPPYSMSHSSAWCCFIAQGDKAILTNTIHDLPARIHFDCGVLLNVSALPFCLPFLCLCFWLNHQITMCLPSQVTVSAVSGWHVAWSFPKVCQLLFSASGDKHQSTHKVKKMHWVLHTQVLLVILIQ